MKTSKVSKQPDRNVIINYEHKGKDSNKDSPQALPQVTWSNEKISELIEGFQAKLCLYNTKPTP